MESLDQGYDDDRFENAVDEDFHCSICRNVFKEAVQCQRNEHHFCTPCITRHLENFQTCPICREELSLETLRKPSRFLMRNLSKLVIRCEYVNRGCDELVQLEVLKTHIMSCDYGPIACSNDGCSVVISKRDKQHHETQICKFRNVKGADYDAMRKERDKLKKRLEHHCKCNTREDIIIAGGRVAEAVRSNSVEMFSWSKRKWEQLQPMREYRSGASSAFYAGQMVVSGGSNGEACFDSIEAININEAPAEWFDFPARLSNKCFAHQSVVYKDRLFIVGGYGGCLDLDSIYEIRLTPPYSCKLISRMPQGRCQHGATLIGNKILIVGGLTNFYECCSDSVVLYDVKTKEYKQMAPLPFGVRGMATVSWGENVILMGGCDKNGKVLNTVVMYHNKTGESYMMPSMKHKRDGCTAVITGNVIVVMGGRNSEQRFLNSVECFSFDSYLWEELLPMNEPRADATAVVKSAV